MNLNQGWDFFLAKTQRHQSTQGMCLAQPLLWEIQRLLLRTMQQLLASSKDKLDTNRIVQNQENPSSGQEKASNTASLSMA